MSVLDNLTKGRAKAPPIAAHPAVSQATEIAKKLEQAESVLAQLEAQRDAVSFEAFSDAPGAKDNLAKLNARVKEAQDSAALLRAAHRGALEKDQAAIRAQRKGDIEKAFRSAVQLLAARDKAAGEYAAAIATAAKQYRSMQEHNTAASAAWKNAQMEWPGGPTENDLLTYAAAEMWRWVTEPSDPMALPGAAPGHVTYIDNPKVIPILQDRLRESSERIKQMLKAKVPE